MQVFLKNFHYESLHYHYNNYGSCVFALFVFALVKYIPCFSSSWVQKIIVSLKFRFRFPFLTIYNYFLFFWSIWKKTHLRLICTLGEVHDTILLIRRGDLESLLHLRWSSLWQLLMAVKNYHKRLNLRSDS